MTALPVWDESYATGDSAIDAQHRELLVEVAKLEEETGDPADQKIFLTALDRVMEFTWVHFDMEEALMTRVRYPPQDHAEMTNQHTEFKNYARIRVLEFRFREVPSLTDFVPFLRNFLVEHEFGLDRKLASFIRISRQSATAHTNGETR